MTNQRFLTGLDIGTNSIKVTVGMPNPDGKLTILALAEVPSEGVVGANITNINKTVEAIREAIRQVSEEAKVTVKQVNVGISGRRLKNSIHRGTLIRESSEGEITQEDVKKLNRDIRRVAIPPGAEIVDIVPREYIVDQEEGIKDPVGMSGIRLEGSFHVLTAPSNTINNIYKCTDRADLKVDNLIPTQFASCLSVLTAEEKEAGVCLIEIGASMMGMAIYHAGSLQHTAMIPIASAAITSDLAHSFMFTESQAEALKIKFGTAYEDETKNEVVIIPGLRNRPAKEIYLPVIDRVIEARLEETIQRFIQPEIVKSGLQNKLPFGIVITGGGAELTGIDELFYYITGYDTRLGYPYDLLRENEANLPSIEFATSIGLVLANYKSLSWPAKFYQSNIETTGDNLQPTTKKKKRKKNRRSFFSFLGF